MTTEQMVGNLIVALLCLPAIAVLWRAWQEERREHRADLMKYIDTVPHLTEALRDLTEEVRDRGRS